MKTKMRTCFSIPTLLAMTALLTGCGRDTRGDTGPSRVEQDATAATPRDEQPAEPGGTHTGNTGQGRSNDASSRPISGMSGSPTGSPKDSESGEKK